MSTKKWTAADVIGLKPCYSAKQVQDVFGVAESMTLREMLATGIPVADKQWLIFRPGVLTLEQIDRLFVLFKKRNPRAYARAYADADAYACARARARAYARAYADADAYACTRARARAYAYARARAYADAYACACADAYADADADADADAYACAYAYAHADALQAQVADVLTILAEDGE